MAGYWPRPFFRVYRPRRSQSRSTNTQKRTWPIDLSRIPLQCVRTIAPERGSGGHFHTFTVFLSTPTSTRRHCLLES